ncbi:MAG: hypothetical protein HY236_17230 [Acidobacteria bacterium]|nr:hypothetical protein [Acidobacteriota bacterium]
MNKTLLASLGLGLAAAAGIVGLIVLKQRGATPDLVGQITAVRTLGMDASSSVAIVDFQFTNESRFPFIVKSCEMSVVDLKGETQTGQVAAAGDANQLFDLFPALGLRTGEPLIIKTRIAPHGSRKAMLTARFEIPKAELDARQKIILTITEVDGAVSQLSK